MANLNTAFGFGIGLVAGEHVFSSMLPSPVTVKSFYQTEAGKEDVQHALLWAIGLSLGAAAILSALLKNWAAIWTVLAISVFYWIEYNRALEGTI